MEDGGIDGDCVVRVKTYQKLLEAETERHIDRRDIKARKRI